MKPTHLLLYIFCALSLFSCSEQSGETINLAGEWQFQTDPDDVGETEMWFSKDFQESVQLPGSMAENGKGDDISLETPWTGSIFNPDWITDPNYAPYEDSLNIKFPFWLQPACEFGYR